MEFMRSYRRFLFPVPQALCSRPRKRGMCAAMPKSPVLLQGRAARIFYRYNRGVFKMQELKPIKEGKVREIYECGDSMIMVATDRISCFDVILNNQVTKKGTVLTQMSKFWFDLTRDVLPNHMESELFSKSQRLSMRREFIP